ncbi:hypothetical protein [Microlunatus soli]|uniref:DUF8094 domain-containing protein n=1 Tax=Microlunatus soli TaxID=630515 RepID=A0A1H1RCC3_9ACTN|nr:hypothetical protein [Microlunatus soli]SDS33371.1 hypothetical protein SAMN04489812_1595 [Microlunatus soli]
MYDGPRLDRRRLLGLVGLAVTVPILAGCQRPGDNVPRLTAAEVQQLQDRYARESFKAMRKRDQALIKTVEAGDLLERDLAAMKLAARLHNPRTTDEFTFPQSTGHPIASTTDSDQQRLVTVGSYSNTTAPWRNLGLYVRQGEAGRWLRVFSGGMYADDVPDFGSEEALSSIAPDSTDFAAVPNTVPSLVAKALQDPDSADAKKFGASDVRQRFADDLATETSKAAAMGTVAREYTPGSLLIAIGINGGYLALGSYSFNQTVTASAGKSVFFAPAATEHKTYPDHYRQVVSDWGGMFAAIVPEAGKLTLVSGEERQTGLEVSR